MATITKNQIRPRSLKAVLTNAEVLALPTTFVALVAAVAGKGYLFKRALLVADDSAGAWTNVDAAAYLRLFCGAAGAVGTSNFGSQLVLASDGLVGSGSRTTWLGPYAEVTVTGGAETALISQDALALTDLSGQALGIKASNAAAGVFTGGNAANTLTVYLWYDVISF
jgi:hypothetical protein